MIVILLSSFMNWLKANNYDDYSTGQIIQTDTAKVTIPIYVIKKANIKLNERIKLKGLTMNQNEQIENYKKIIRLKDSKINILEDNIENYKSVNESYQEELYRIKKQNNKLIGFTIGSIAITITVLAIIIF